MLLLEIGAKRIPRKLLERDKKGFTVPLTQWLKGPLKPMVEDSFNKNFLRKQGLLNEIVLDQLYKQFYQGSDDLAPLVWSVVMFQNWYKSQFSLIRNVENSQNRP